MAKDGFFIAVFGWILVSAASGLPFMVHGSIPSFTDAFFEMMSGYTTSGGDDPYGYRIRSSRAFVLAQRNPSARRHGVFNPDCHFSTPTVWAGCACSAPNRARGRSLPRRSFQPRNRDTMVWLWGIYLALNILETGLLVAGGMSLFDSLCHAFGTVSTSGYSPKKPQHRALRECLLRLGSSPPSCFWAA